jgi:hypothetical protein
VGFVLFLFSNKMSFTCPVPYCDVLLVLIPICFVGGSCFLYCFFYIY